MIPYEDLTLRNNGYIPDELQSKIRGTRLLLAGCGLGSVVAEVALRTGFERMVLVDGDNVEAHNLNRQAYCAADVNTPKVTALAQRLLSIYPQAKLETHTSWVNADTVQPLVAQADVVMDTIDFLDLPAVIALHDEAGRQGKPVISAFSAAWGSVVMVFLPGGVSFREVLGVPKPGSIATESYVVRFGEAFTRMSQHLSPEMVAVTSKTIRSMLDNKPCPAPQLGVGTYCTAATMITVAVRLLSGLPVSVSPKLIHVNLGEIVASADIQALP